MFYPNNFPRQLEQPIMLLLGRLEKKFEKIRTAESLKKQLRIEVKDGTFQKIFGTKIPPNWWLNFVLLRHESEFTPQFVLRLQPLLTKTKTRSLSGIVPLSLFTEGTGCPFNCVYCPNEPGIPKSYFSDEPAVMRAVRHHFDPYEQTLNRLIMFALSNHPIDKVEVIIKGGTFSFYPEQYRERFVKRIYDACNTDVWMLIKKGTAKDADASSLTEAQELNETAASRIIGINIETRPDYINRNELVFLRRLGVTHVEMGVQMPDDTLYRLIRRGHTVEQVADATKLLKDAGFKVGYHLMPNLPGSSPEKDLALMELVFTDDRFKPDHLKLYPTTVTFHSDLEKWFRDGTYTPYPIGKLLEVIREFKMRIVPPWLRIGRLTRDITTDAMTIKQFAPNLREIVQLEMKDKNMVCPCIRCREIRDAAPELPFRQRTVMYSAAGGAEYFIEYVDNKERSLGFIRLRLTLPALPFPGLEKAALVRELHVYGQALPLGRREAGKIQHMKFGRQLLASAEEIAKREGFSFLAVIAGVGVRDYYRKQGYAEKETYMVKCI